MMLFCQGTKHSSWLFPGAMVTYLCCHLTSDLRGAWHTVFAMLL